MNTQRVCGVDAHTVTLNKVLNEGDEGTGVTVATVQMDANTLDADTCLVAALVETSLEDPRSGLDAPMVDNLRYKATFSGYCCYHHSLHHHSPKAPPPLT